MRFTLVRGISIVLITAALVVAGTLGVFWHWLNAPMSQPSEEVVWEVQSGQSVATVAAALHQKGWLDWPRVWRAYARFFDTGPVLVGEYALQPSMTPRQLLDQLQSGQVLQYRITLVEGQSIKDYLNVLADAKRLKHTLNASDWRRLPEILALDIQHPEGWFYPDTYQYVLGDSDADILRRAHSAMKQQLREAWEARADGLPFTTPYEALIMASIIEKETGAAFERPAIAGVFVRRLEQRMRLQTDPTVIYGLGDQFDGNLTRKHLRTPTPYNTYTEFGLPPTPIANPGRAAIEAALNPEAGAALYFVAKGDGTHVFSDSLEAHNRAVKHYQMHRRAEGYRSAPQ